MVLIAAVYTTYVLALTFGGAQWAWSDGRFITMATVCGALLMAFILTQFFLLSSLRKTGGSFLVSFCEAAV